MQSATCLARMQVAIPAPATMLGTKQRLCDEYQVTPASITCEVQSRTKEVEVQPTSLANSCNDYRSDNEKVQTRPSSSPTARSGKEGLTSSTRHVSRQPIAWKEKNVRVMELYEIDRSAKGSPSCCVLRLVFHNVPVGVKEERGVPSFTRQTMIVVSTLAEKAIRSLALPARAQPTTAPA